MGIFRAIRQSPPVCVLALGRAVGFAVLVGAALSSAGASPTRSVSSALEIDYPPFCFLDEAGEPTGFSVELMRAAVQAMGGEVSYRAGVWADIRQWLEDGHVAALPLVGRTPEREAVFDFTIPYLTMHGAIVVHKSTTGIDDLRDLRGKRVAVMRGDNAEEFLRRDDRGVSIHTTDTFATALTELDAGQHDAVVMQRIVALRLISELGLDNLRLVDRFISGFQQDFCFAVTEGDRETLALLNEGLATTMADGTYRKLHTKWFAALELPSDRPILVGCDENFPPFEYMNSDGEPDGFNVHLVRAIARELNLEVEFRMAPWRAIRAALARGEIDIAAGMMYSPEREVEFDFAPGHIVIHSVAVVRAEDGPAPTTIEALRNKRLVVQAEDIMHDFVRQHGLEEQTSVVRTQEMALREVVEGKHDCALVARLTAWDWMHHSDREDVDVGQRPLFSAEYCFAAPEGQKALLAQFADGIRILQRTGEYRKIHQQWLGVYEEYGPSGELIVRYAAFVLIPLIVILAASVAWTWSMRKQVAYRTEALRTSEERMRAIIACSPIALYSIDLHGNVETWNQSAEKLFGWSAEEVLGRPLPLVPADKTSEYQVFFDTLMRGESIDAAEVVRLKKDGTRFDGSLSLAPMRDAKGKTIGVMGAMMDISEKKRAEVALRSSEEQFRTLVEGAPDAIVIHAGGMIQYANRACLDMLAAATSSDVVGTSAVELLHPERRDGVMERLRCVEEGHPPENAQVEILISLVGDTVPVEISAVPFHFRGQPAALFFARDIRARLKAERALEESERRFRSAIVEAPFPAMIHASDGEVLVASRAWTKLSGYDAKDLCTIQAWTDHAYGDRAAEVRALAAETHALTAPARQGEFEIRCADGSSRVWDFSSTPLGTLPDGRSIVISMAADVTERKQAEARIGHLNRVLRAIRDVNQLIVREDDRNTLIREACRLLVDSRGYAYSQIVLCNQHDEVIAWSDAGENVERSRWAAVLEAGGMPYWVDRVDSNSGPMLITVDSGESQQPLDGTGDMVCVRLTHDETSFGFLAVMLEAGEDVDDEELALIADMAGDIAYALHVAEMDRAREEIERRHRELQERMVQAQKLESVGRLAGGVAHDYNNFLSVIMGYTELAMQRVHSGDAIHADLVEILDAATRSAEITRQLLAFARKQTINPKILDINMTIEGMLKMLRRLIGEDIELVWRPDPAVWSVNVDPVQVDQILANLCVNARDAIEGVGTITIETTNIVLTAADCIDKAEKRPGDFVVLSVSDDGCGMEREILGSIFEPFFTTKDINAGTGLGLATVYGIAKQNGGFINVYSESSNGSTFKIYLPRHMGPKEAIPEVRAAIPPSKGEKVLLVEDDPAIMKMGKMMLEKLGYRVTAVNAPKEAIRIAQDKSHDIQLLITDVIMPEMNGRDLAHQLQRIDSKLKVLFMSGYTADVIAHRGILDEGVQFIAKPFTLSELARKIRRVLDETG